MSYSNTEQYSDRNLGDFSMEDYKKQYLDWLNANTTEAKICAKTSRITLPYLNRRNDMLDIYIIKNDDGFYLTDDGEIIHDLELSGLSLDKGKRKELLNQTLKSFGIKADKDHSLFVDASSANLPIKLHMLAQCMLKIDDMFYLSRQNVKSVFADDVRSFLEQNAIRFIPRVLFSGTSGLPTLYDFSVPGFKSIPERNIKVINNLTLDSARTTLFGWIDTVDTRSSGSQLYAFINDENRVQNDAILALQKYEIHPVPWSKRKDVVSDLVA